MKIKKSLAGLLALAMMISMVTVPVSAVEIEESSFAMNTSAAVTVDGTTDQTVSVVLSANAAMSIVALEGTFSTKEAENTSYISLTDYESPVTLTGTNYFYPSTGQVVYADANLDGYSVEENGAVMTAVYTVSKDTPTGTYTVKFNATNIQEGDFNQVENAVYTAEISVNNTSGGAPEPSGKDFELYYTLSTTADEDSDNYLDAAPNGTVTATVYLKNKSGEEKTLQGYDVFVKNDALLTGATVSGWAENVTGKEVSNTGTLTRIQYIGDALQKVMADDTFVALATITYTVSNDAVYDVELPIAIDTDAENAIAIGGTALDEIPEITKTHEGVEVTTKYDVTFNSNGGSTVAGAEVGHGLTVTKPTDPTKTGYTFGGWYSDEDLNTGWNFDTAVKAGTTLYAKWDPAEVSYTVKHLQQDVIGDGYTEVESETLTGFTDAETAAAAKEYTGFTAQTITQKTIAANGSTVVEIKYDRNTYTVIFDSKGGSEVTALTNVKHGSMIAQPATPTYAGYGFGGWYKDSGCTNAWDFATDTVTEATTLYAKWTLNNYTVTFINGNETYTTKSVEHGGKVSKPETDPTKTGYTFDGWYNGNDEWNFEANTVTETLTLTAKWTAEKYTITYELDGGTNASGNSAEYTIETDTITLEDATKEYYEFKGWYTNAQFVENSKVTEIAKGSTGNVILYAKFTAKEYAITYELNGGTNASGNPAKYTVEDSTITLSAPTRNWYTFEGWYVNEECTGEAVTQIVTSTGGAKTFYAKWVAAFKMEDYAYAKTGDQLLIIDAAVLDSDKAPAVSDEQMYYTTDANYGYAASYLYIVSSNFDVSILTTVTKTDDHVLDKSKGDVNNNGKTDIGDANAVYQMLRAGGSYYDDQVSVLGRLIADMSTSLDNATNRGNAADAKAIVDILNGVSPTA